MNAFVTQRSCGSQASLAAEHVFALQSLEIAVLDADRSITMQPESIKL